MLPACTRFFSQNNEGGGKKTRRKHTNRDKSFTCTLTEPKHSKSRPIDAESGELALRLQTPDRRAYSSLPVAPP